MKLVRPVMGEEEAQATVTVLRAVIGKRLLVEADLDKIRHAVEALEHAPVVAVVPEESTSESGERRFDGTSFDQQRDGKRLTKQLNVVLGYMIDGEWRTLAEVQKATGVASSASASARIRDLRKSKFGGYTVQRRSVTGGVHAYRVLAPGTPQDHPYTQPAPAPVTA